MLHDTPDNDADLLTMLTTKGFREEKHLVNVRRWESHIGFLCETLILAYDFHY